MCGSDFEFTPNDGGIHEEIVEISSPSTSTPVGEARFDGPGAGQLPTSTSDEQGHEEALLQLAMMLLDDTQVNQAVQEVLRRAVATFPAETMVSITLHGRDHGARLTNRASTSVAARDLDRWQYAHGEGPCVEADESRDVCVVLDTRDDRRFPRFSDAATRAGVGSVASFPMVAGGRSVGSINAFHGTPGALTDTELEAGRRLARTSAPLLANWLTHHNATELADQLAEALEGRGTIERAKGLLMGHLGVGADEAFELLTTQSQRENVRVREIARRLLRDRDATSEP